MEMLCFRLPGHGDTTLKHMDQLRSRQHFCDITIVASDNQTFKGHKVVLAACSPFLRDQFLLSPSSKLQVSMLYSSTVVCDLLQSCYTGVLQFNPEEIVNYLTAASYLQMEHIVERCRGALKKYMQLKNLTSQKVLQEDGLSTRHAAVSGDSDRTPSVSHQSSEQPPSPMVRFVEEAHDARDLSTQGSGQHSSDSPSYDELCIKVNASDEEEQAAHTDCDTFRIYVADEQMDRDKHMAANDAPEDYPEPDDVLREEGEYDSNPAKEDIRTADGFLKEGLLVNEFKHRLLPARSGRGRGRGRGFKRRRSSLEKRLAGLGHHADMWYIANAGMAGFGMDFSPDGLKPGDLMSVDPPRFSVGGERLSPLATNRPFSLEESSSGVGEGTSAITVGTKEGGDESVAVVGSTSSVTGPVICEHCNMTFSSAHVLTIHSCSTHMQFTCPCCGKQFHNSAKLSRHMMVHRGLNKTHQCPLCYKTFTQKSTLIDHMNLHSGERPHRCAYCHARFAHKPALRRHLKEQHGKTTGQNSLHEQEERERAAIQMQDEECLASDRLS
ncbi:uncharacterized protein ACB058_000081 isoform 1-T2 [Synchiropus picturatus]